MRGRTAELRRGATARPLAALSSRAGLVLLALVTALSVARAADIAPFEARYEVVWRGMQAGTAHLSLQRLEGDRWRYESRNNARGLFRLAIPGEIHQTSDLRIGESGVVPLHFRTDDGSDKGKRDVDVRFDWDAGRATGTAEERKVDVALVPGLQDTLSVQIALIHELLAGRMPTNFTLLDKDQVKEYEYLDEGRERLETTLGSHDTLRYRSRRPDSDRGTVFWCAPELGFLPLKVERQRGGKVEWSMRLVELKQ